MFRRIPTLLIAVLTLTACAHGAKRIQEVTPPVPDLVIPPTHLELCPETLPQPDNGSRSELLRNHIEVARMYHECRIKHRALACAVEGQQGVTINGAKPTAREACASPKSGGDPPTVRALSNCTPVVPFNNNAGPSMPPPAGGVPDTSDFALCVPLAS